MSFNASAYQSAVSDAYHFFTEALDESFVPATVGLFTAGSAGAASSLSVALGLFFCKKTAEYYFPDLRGNPVMDAGIEIAKLGSTALNSAGLIRSDHCELRGNVFKSGNFIYDVGKTAFNYASAFVSRKMMTDEIFLVSDDPGIILRYMFVILLVSQPSVKRDRFFIKYLCS